MYDPQGDTDTEDPTERLPDANAERPRPVLSRDEVMWILSDPDRRAMLRYVDAAPEPVASLQDLMTHVADSRAAGGGVRPTERQVKIALLHVHIPALTNAGVAEYDLRSEQLRYLGNERLDGLLDRIREAGAIDE